MSEPTPTSRPDNLLNERYRLETVIGQGGMAIVWRAEDLLLERAVAVKILRDQYAKDPEFLGRFRSEARSAAALNDPGVVGVYDVGEDSGRHYLVMEYVPGQDLKQVIRDEAPLAPDRVVGISASLARAVGQAHAIGLVHRDVKPQNVLVTPDGRMKVTDFGIARAVSDAGMTQPGIVLGTVHYLAPEQAAGRQASPASDVYALGVVMYEMLTGRVPFAADSGVGVAMKILHEDPEPLEKVNPGVPAALLGIVQRAMARQPENRYQDATSLSEALAGYAEWSEGATMTDFRPAPAPEGSASPAPNIPPSRRPLPAGADLAEAGRAEGPLLDRTGLLLGLIALAAIVGLIPLWSALSGRLGEGPGDAGSGPREGGTDQVSVADPLPTAEPTIMMVEVPNLEGLLKADAFDELKKVGLSFSEELEPDATTAIDHVIRQIPPAGSIEPGGSVIKLIVSGEAQTMVPSLQGTVNSVSQAMRDVGLKPRVRFRWQGAGSPSDGQVIEIDPLPGTRLPFGAPVDLTVDGGAWKPLGVDYEDNVFLGGIHIGRATFAAGETISLTPTWEAVGVIAGDYVARAELWALSGEVIQRVERPLAADGRPANAWAELERVAGQSLELVIPPETLDGAYSVFLDLVPVGQPESSLLVRRNSSLERQIGNRIEVIRVRVSAIEAPAEGEQGAEGGEGG